MIQALIILVVSFVVGIVVSIALDGGNPVVAGFRLLPVFFVIVGLIYVPMCNMFTGGIAKKTMNQNCEKENFGESSTFITDG